MRTAALTALIIIFSLSALMAVPRNYVVVEIGTRTGCPACPGAAMGANDLLSNGQKVAIIDYHVGDTFTNTYSETRYSYYAIPGTPTAHFDGLNRTIGGSGVYSLYSNYLPKVTARLSVDSHYTISATGTYSGNQYFAGITVAKPEDDSNTNVVLHAAVTESHIPFVWYNQTTVENTIRQMMPSYNGTAINLSTGAQTILNLNYTMNPAWNAHNCELVLWLQNTASKEILQCNKYPFDLLYRDFSATPLSGTAPFDVQFQSTVQDPELTLDWDFENDGIYDSQAASPVHTYTQAGSYSVRLKVNYGTRSETLLKTNYITVAAPILPLSPQSPQVEFSGSDALISWNAVIHNTLGNQVVIDHYDVYYSDQPFAAEENWQLLTSTSQLSASDPGALLSAPKRFYRVIAVQ